MHLVVVRIAKSCLEVLLFFFCFTLFCVCREFGISYILLEETSLQLGDTFASVDSLITHVLTRKIEHGSVPTIGHSQKRKPNLSSSHKGPTMVSFQSALTGHNTHRRAHDGQVPIFETNPTGGPPKSKYVMGMRNWCSVRWDAPSGDLVFDIRVEQERGCGQTVGYVRRFSSWRR